MTVLVVALPLQRGPWYRQVPDPHDTWLLLLALRLGAEQHPSLLLESILNIRDAILSTVANNSQGTGTYAEANLFAFTFTKNMRGCN